MDKRNKIIVSIVGIFIILLALVGITYGYFLTQIQGNTNDNSVYITTANLRLVYSDNESLIRAENIMPDDTVYTKTFTVTNEGNAVVDYEVYIENVINELVHEEDLLMFITCESNIDGNTCNGYGDGTVTGNIPTFGTSIYPTVNSKVIENSISPATNTQEKEIHTYKLYLQFKDDGSDQSIDMGKTIQGHVQIYDPQDIVSLSGKVTGNQTGNYIEIERLNNDNEVIETKTSEITNNEYILTGVVPGTYNLNVKNSANETVMNKTIIVAKGETANISEDGTNIVITSDSVETFANINISNTSLESSGIVTAQNNNNSITLKLTDNEVTSEDEVDLSTEAGPYQSYYGTTNGIISETPVSVPLVDFSVAGDGNYICEYTMNVTASANDSLYDAYQTFGSEDYPIVEKAIRLYVNGKFYSFYGNGENLFPMEISGKVYDISSDNPVSIKTTLSYNSAGWYSADALIDKDITLDFELEELNCYAEVEEELAFEDTLGGQLLNKAPRDFTEELVGGMYRYQGTDTGHLGICLGLEDYSSSSIDAMTCSASEYQIFGDQYQIIGITEDGHVKAMYAGTIGNYIWNDTNSGTWSTSSLFEGLNGSFFLDNIGYSYMFLNYNWKYGTYNYLGTETYDEIYEAENAWTDTEKAKVGLLNISDVFYSYDGQDLTYIPSYTPLYWVSSGTSLITAKNEASIYVMDSEEIYATEKTSEFSVAPVVYLKSTLNVVSGDGIDNLFILEY